MKRRTRSGSERVYLVPEPTQPRVGGLLSRARAEILQAERVGRRPPSSALEARHEALAILAPLGRRTPASKEQWVRTGPAAVPVARRPSTAYAQRLYIKRPPAATVNRQPRDFTRRRELLMHRQPNPEADRSARLREQVLEPAGERRF